MTPVMQGGHMRENCRTDHQEADKSGRQHAHHSGITAKCRQGRGLHILTPMTRHTRQVGLRSHMAGLLARGSARFAAFPGETPSGQLAKRSPHTVAGAAVELAP